MMPTISVLGAGAWGTALALTAVRSQGQVTLWARSQDHISQMEEIHENHKLPGIPLPPTLKLTSDLEEALSKDIILMVTPAQTTRQMAALMRPYLENRPNPPILVTCSKGLEMTTHTFLLDILKEELPGTPTAVLSGPSFATEVGRGLPTAVTIASDSMEIAHQVSQALAHKTFRPYSTDDILGVQLGGALKNVMAIATGAMEGRNLGQNCRALTITRGLAEITRLGTVIGGRLETFYGLSGIGDLTLTCSTPESRNMRLGIEIGRSNDPQAVLKNAPYLAEGIPTTKATHDLAASLNIEMPITQAIYNVVYGGMTLDDALDSLLSRPLKSEA